MKARIGVIGGGIIGVAVARSLAVDRGLDVTVLEKEGALATHQTGRNSGVVHAGVYYQPGSLKALLCARGRNLTREFCLEHDLPYRELGKLVIATSPRQLGALAELEQRARANGVPGLRRVSAGGILDIEPHARGVAALHSPQTAVVDYAAITETMADEMRGHGGSVLLAHEVVSISTRAREIIAKTSQGTLAFNRVIVCGGLQSDLLAVEAGGDPSPKILPFRGEYRNLTDSSRTLVRGMIYPVPDPRFPFLGVHFTRSVYDEVRVGPNAVPALAREGYRWRDISASDIGDSLRWPGARALARKHLRMGATEVAGSILKPVYFRQAQRFIPELRMADLGPKTRPGVRAQAWSRDGKLLDDFAVEQLGAITLLRNAPSPAATSAMAIAEYLIENHVFAGSAGL